MGKRYLRQQLLNPLMDPVEIQHRYDLIELMITNKRYVEYENHLKYIPDIERLHRKLCLKKIQPYEFVSLHMAYSRIIDLCNRCIDLFDRILYLMNLLIYVKRQLIKKHCMIL